MRKYPYDNLGYNDDIPRKLAVALVIKFLMQNRCLREFVEAWRQEKRKPNASSKEAIESCVNYIYTSGGTLTTLFSSISASFAWGMAETVLNQKIKWYNISEKWYKTIPSLYVIK